MPVLGITHRVEPNHPANLNQVKNKMYCANSVAIVLQPCGRCRWEGQYKDN